jgi:hypothetical protein
MQCLVKLLLITIRWLFKIRFFNIAIMKNKTHILFYTLLIALFAISSCKKDNYKAPQSYLTGHVTYQGAPVGVRSNGYASGGAQLQLWQHGYQFFTPIPVYIAFDGSYSALLFDGDYLLTKLAGAPWVNQTDSIKVHVSGNTVVDVPVTPYFMVSSATYTNTATTVTSTITITKPNASSTLEAVRLYLSSTTLVDQNYNAVVVNIAPSTVTVGTAFTVTATIPAALLSADAIYARVGVKTTGVAELEYSAPQKIQLK